MAKVALIVDHPLLAAVDEQRSLATANGAERAVDVSPRTGEDWHYRIREALGGLAAGDAVLVSSLTSLGLSSAQLFDGLEAITDAKLALVSIAEGIDTAGDDGFLQHVGMLSEAIEAGRLLLAREVIERAEKRGTTVSPPKAEFVDADLWDQVHAQ